MMTDTQELLANFVKNGSESAFRELVTRYLDLVYSTAVRLVDGDPHKAEDISQVVLPTWRGLRTNFRQAPRWADGFIDIRALWRGP